MRYPTHQRLIEVIILILETTIRHGRYYHALSWPKDVNAAHLRHTSHNRHVLLHYSYPYELRYQRIFSLVIDI